MASLSRIYTDTSGDDRLAAPRARYGGPRRRRTATTRYERNEYYGTTVDYLGSHMPIDTGIHWEWRNPLNVLPALILFMLAVALVALVIG
ncbi:MAG TPA: hypothetical protein VGJ87_26160 [Roseiflexaceae bacterium]